MLTYRWLMSNTIIEAFNKAVNYIHPNFSLIDTIDMDDDGYITLNDERLFRIEKKIDDEALKNYYGSLLMCRQSPAKSLLALRDHILGLN